MRVMMVIDNDVLRSIRRARALFWVLMQPPTWWLHWVLPAHLFFGITKEKENSGFGVAWIGGRWMVTTAVGIFFLICRRSESRGSYRVCFNLSYWRCNVRRAASVSSYNCLSSRSCVEPMFIKVWNQLMTTTKRNSQRSTMNGNNKEILK